MNEGRKVGVIFLDLRRAFDWVDHDLLLRRLQVIGVTGNELALFGSYLDERVSVVEINGARSGARTMHYAVPQGSVIGPTLFNIFVDPVLRLGTDALTQLFADDEAMVIDTTNLDDLFDLM